MKVSGVIWFTTLFAVLFSHSSASYFGLKAKQSGVSLWSSGNTQLKKDPLEKYGGHKLIAWILVTTRDFLASFEPITGWVYDGLVRFLIYFPSRILLYSIRWGNVIVGVVSIALLIPFYFINRLLVAIPFFGPFISTAEWAYRMAIVVPIQVIWNFIVQAKLITLLVPTALLTQFIQQILRFFVVSIINLPLYLMVGYKDAALSVIAWWK